MANNKEKDSAGKTFSYSIAKNVLSDTEKNRLLCLFLNMDHSSVRPPHSLFYCLADLDERQINWAKATEEFECKSIDSMRVMTRATFKKITEAEKNGGTLPGKGSKRKAADDGEEGASPVKKWKGAAGGRKKKKADTPVEGERADQSSL